MLFSAGLAHSDIKFVESCLRFLRTMLTSPIAPTEILFQVRKSTSTSNSLNQHHFFQISHYLLFSLLQIDHAV